MSAGTGAGDQKLRRQMNLLAALLHTRVPLSAQQLREMIFEYDDTASITAFRRQFSRDKEELRDMGVPLIVTTIPASDPPIDGYRVDPDEYYLDDPDLDADELAALRLAAQLIAADDPVDQTGLFKLGGLIGGAVATDDNPRAPVPVDPHLGTLLSAVGGDRVVGFDYADRSRRVVPRGLGFQNGRWYVRGLDLDTDTDRVFRLDRIGGGVDDLGPAPHVEPTAGSLGPMQPWRIGNGPSRPVALRVAPVAATGVLAQLRGHGTAVLSDSGFIELTLEVADDVGFCFWVLGFGSSVEVVDPPEMRKMIVDHLDGIIAKVSS
ncbi:MAG: WYL domain-containing protein [Actinobacteria bacterium]|nr:WYL domain-containing protein [Actinomycetota bacterium]